MLSSYCSVLAYQPVVDFLPEQQGNLYIELPSNYSKHGHIHKQPESPSLMRSVELLSSIYWIFKGLSFLSFWNIFFFGGGVGLSWVGLGERWRGWEGLQDNQEYVIYEIAWHLKECFLVVHLTALHFADDWPSKKCIYKETWHKQCTFSVLRSIWKGIPCDIAHIISIEHWTVTMYCWCRPFPENPHSS